MMTYLIRDAVAILGITLLAVPRTRRGIHHAVLSPYRALDFPRQALALLATLVVVSATVVAAIGDAGAFRLTCGYVAGAVLIIMARSPKLNRERLTLLDRVQAATVGRISSVPQPVIWWSTTTCHPHRFWRTWARCLACSFLWWVLACGIVSNTLSVDPTFAAGPHNLLIGAATILYLGVICGLQLACYSQWGRKGYWTFQAVFFGLLLARSWQLHRAQHQAAVDGS